MKKILLLSTCMLVAVFAKAQWGEEEMSEKPTFRERVFTGGGLGLSFSDSYDYVSVSPLIGYRITPKLAGGLQLQYRYTKYKYVTPKVSTNDYGVAPFLRFNLYGPLFLHAEYEYLNFEYPVSAGESVRMDYNSLLLGGGFFQPLGRSAGFYVVALYNVTYSDPDPGEFAPYDNPLVLRVGVTAGF
ncbi:MAG TPA: hypothetical protein VGK59_13305 [Ohtaekwangia sp.]